MGDAGALFLGLLMAAATMEIGGRTEGVSGQTYFFYAPLFLPLFILGVPIGHGLRLHPPGGQGPEVRHP